MNFNGCEVENNGLNITKLIKKAKYLEKSYFLEQDDSTAIFVKYEDDVIKLFLSDGCQIILKEFENKTSLKDNLFKFDIKNIPARTKNIFLSDCNIICDGIPFEMCDKTADKVFNERISNYISKAKSFVDMSCNENIIDLGESFDILNPSTYVLIQNNFMKNMKNLADDDGMVIECENKINNNFFLNKRNVKTLQTYKKDEKILHFIDLNNGMLLLKDLKDDFYHVLSVIKE